MTASKLASMGITDHLKEEYITDIHKVKTAQQNELTSC